MRIYKLKKAPETAAKLATVLDISVEAIVEPNGVDVAFFRPYSTPAPAASLVPPAVIVKGLFTGRLPDDPAGTEFAASPSFVLMRQFVNKNQSPGAPEEVSTFVRMDRFVDGLRVFGTGSLAIAEVRGSEIVGTVSRWDRAVPFLMKPTLELNESRIKNEFASKVGGFTGTAVVEPDSPELVYVGDRQFLEPAYRVLYRIPRHLLPDGTIVPDDFGVLYVPATEPMPRPSEPVELFNPIQCPDAVAGVQGIPLDLYAMFDFSFDWAGSARAFRKSMTNQSGITGRRFCYLESRMLGTDKKYFLNSIPVAHLETHGLPGFVLTAEDDGVKLAQTGGYGVDEEQGQLRLLVLHSCEVIESHCDNPNWYQTWFAVFRGLHTAVGYRTKALMDGVPAAFGVHVVSGRPILRSWIAEVAAVPDYRKGHVVESTGGPKPLGRPAAVTVCKHDHDTLHELADLSNPQCLVSYWLKN